MNYDASNARKYPFGLAMGQFAAKKIADVVAQFGGRLPCQVVAVAGQIVTVSFEVNAAPFTLPQVSMPIATSFYDWLPIRVGDQGVTMTADVYIGGVSGLGGGAANLSRPGNLATLIYVPVSNSLWPPPVGVKNADGSTAGDNYRIVQGPGGVLIQDLIGKTLIQLYSQGQTIIAVASGGFTVKGPLIVDGYITATGDITGGEGVANISLVNHEHGGVQVGSGNTSAPVVNT